MTPDGLRFGAFTLDPANRRLSRAGETVEISTRYLDALILMVGRPGQLVSKDQFLDEVWRGVPVTDEALTQCIRTLRKQLGDTAGRPRFIETVPKHGYRFIAAVTPVEAGGVSPGPAVDGTGPTAADSPYDLNRTLLLGGAGVLGGGLAGVIGGLIYGLIAVSHPLQPGMGSGSILLVLVWLTTLVALMGGAAVGIGMAATGLGRRRPSPWIIFGGALGGMTVGGAVKLLGLDAFNLLVGRSPGDITGGMEGFILGGAIGLGLWLGARGRDPLPLRRCMITAGIAAALAGMAIPLFGGRLMGGSLDLLARTFPESQLQLGMIGDWFGETGFGPIAQSVTGGLEGLLFAPCVVGAMILARRGLKAD
ncbi:winged helix-turn-helix domain-containing protein [Brevundimonas sp.]|uniref:winged helix-turn-helix domain-containing protein n=1 Tax=Brevundimonas sp. TaxID=1871086 RepID=UPI003AF864B5